MINVHTTDITITCMYFKYSILYKRKACQCMIPCIWHSRKYNKSKIVHYKHVNTSSSDYQVAAQDNYLSGSVD